MARPRAADHEDKRQALLARAAELFAAHGYDRASLAMIARACGVSKALVYHYYPDKEALLFDVLERHLRELVDIARAVGRLSLPPLAKLATLAERLLDAYRDADAVHRVQIACLPLLSQERQERLKALERELVEHAAAILTQLHPDTARDRRVLKPLAMSFFALLNWHYLWHRKDGPLSRADYARMAAALVAAGAPAALDAVRAPAGVA